MSARTNHLSELKTTTNSSFANMQMTSFADGVSKSKLKVKKQEEGFEGLPQQAKIMKEDEFEQSDSCFSCQKSLKKKLGALMKKGRHHCRRCGRTVCDKCWQNQKRISQSDKTVYQVCDQCDFEISNFHLFQVLDKVKSLQQDMNQALLKKNQTLEQEIKAYKEQRKDLQQEQDQKQDDFEQIQTRLKTQLQTINFQSERLENQKKILDQRLESEQDKKGKLLSETSDLKLKEHKLKGKLSQLEMNERQLIHNQEQEMMRIEQNFSQETIEMIKMEFERVRNLKDSEIIENSDFIYLCDSMAEENSFRKK
eukprot:403354017